MFTGALIEYKVLAERFSPGLSAMIKELSYHENLLQKFEADTLLLKKDIEVNRRCLEDLQMQVQSLESKTSSWLEEQINSQTMFERRLDSLLSRLITTKN